MTTLIGAAEASRILGVTKPTLYAYVSRGIIERRTAVDGRTSLYPRDAVEALAARQRSRRPAERPSIDVQISSSITTLADDGITIRGHDLVALSTAQPFESVAELLWTGEVPTTPPSWPVDRDLLDRCRATIDASGVVDPIARLSMAATIVGSGTEPGSSAAPVARHLIALAPSLLGGPLRGTTAERSARAWARRPSDDLVRAVDRALVLLADHELATSTLAVRVAASVRTDPGAALACGLATVGGRLHGRAAAETVALFRSAADMGAGPAVRRWTDGGRRLPGFGHSVYRNGDPRFEPLFATVEALDDRDGRWPVVAEVLVEAGARIDRLPNIDFALGALHFVAGLPDDTPLFAVARIAGWAAHHDEELGERPVRFRGMTRAR